MIESSMTDEWDQLVVKMGRLALAVGYLEVAVIGMVCRILGQHEEEVGIWSNHEWCKKLNEIAPADWADDTKKDLEKRLSLVRQLYRKRNKLIHAALGIAGDNSISGVPAGSVINLRTYGIGFTKREGNTWTIGTLGERIDLQELDALIEEIHDARLGFVPFMELVDKIRHPAKQFPMPEVGKRL